MATKKNDLDDLNFDDDIFGEMDLFGEEGASPKGRHPVRTFATSFGQGAKDAIKSPSLIKKLAAQVLPGGYGSAINLGEEIVDGGRRLYNEAADEIKPALPAIRKAAEKLYDASEGKAPKAIREMLKEFSENGGETYRTPSQGEQDESRISEELASMMGTVAEANAKRSALDRSERYLRQKVEDRREGTMLNLLASQSNSLDRLVQYQDRQTNRFQQKMLELGYRKTFMMRDSLVIQRETFGMLRDGLKALVHNTALPDFAKKSSMDAAKDSFRERLLGNVQTRAGKYVSGFTENILGNLSTKLKEAVGGIAQGIQGAGDMNDSLSDMDEMGIPGGRLGMVSNTLGGMVTEALAPYMAMPLEKLLGRHKRVGRSGAKLGLSLSQIPEKFHRWTNSDTDTTSIRGSGLQMLKELLRQDVSQETKVGESALLSADRPVPFDNMTRKSIVDVIPGFLSRIHHEIAMMRTGDSNISRVVYNTDRGRFTTVSTASGDMRDRLFNKNNVFQVQQSLNDVVDRIDDGTLTPELRKKLAKKLLGDSQRMEVMDDDYFSESRLGSTFDGSEAQAIRKAYENRMRLSNGQSNVKRQQGLVDAYGMIRSRTFDPMSAMQVYRDTGNIDLLDELGLVNNVDTDGSGRVDRASYDRIYDLMLEGEGVAPERKKATDNAFTRMGKQYVGKWERKSSEIAHRVYNNKTYRKATGKMGDLAEAGIGKVRRWSNGEEDPYQFASDLYEDGLTEAKSRVDDLAGEEGFTDRKVSAAKAQVRKGRRKARRVKGRLQKSVKRVCDVYTAEGLQPALTAAGIEAGEYRDQATEQVIRSLDDVKGPVINQKDQVVLAAQDMASGVYDEHGEEIDTLVQKGRSYLQSLRQRMRESKMGSGLSSGLAFLRGQGSRVSSAYRRGGLGGAQEELRDIYVEGRKHPAITAAALQMGEYRDQLTGKIVRTVDDIQGPVVDSTGNVVLSAADFAKGLRNSAGEKLTSLVERAKARIEQMQDRVHQTFERREALQEEVGAQATSNQSFEELVGLNQQQVELLSVIHETMQSLNFGAGEGTDGAPSAPRRGLMGTLTRGVGRVAAGGARLYGKYVKGVFGAGWGGLKLGARSIRGAAGMVFGSRKREASDIFVKGQPDEPVLFRVKMVKGQYMDRASEKTIRNIDDIKGVVIDLESKNVALTQEDFDKGIYDNTGRKGPGVLGTIGKKVLGAFGAYSGSVLALPFKLGKMAIDFGLKGLSMVNEEQDVYLKGQLNEPVLLNKHIKAGLYWSTKKQKPIRSYKDVDGEIRYVNGDVNRVVITEDEYASKALVNWRGKPLRTLGQGAVGLLGGAIGLAGRSALGLAKGYAKVVGSVLGAGRDMIVGTAKGIGRFFNPKGHPIGAEEKNIEVLSDILSLLDSRLPKPKRIRKGSWEEKFAKRDQAEAEAEKNKSDKSDDEKGPIGKLMGWLGSKARGLFGGGDEEGEDGDTTIIGGMGGDKDGKGKGKPRGRFGRMKDALGRGFRKIPGVGRLGALAGGIGLGGGMAAGAAGLGGGYLGYKASDSAMNALGVEQDSGWRTAANTTAGLGGGALAALGAIKGLGALAAAGGVKAVGGTALTAVAGLLSAPVLLGAAAVAGVGALGYVGYQAYRNLRSDPFRKLRMAQYGVSVKDYTQMNHIESLEKICDEAVRSTPDGMQLNNKALDPKKIFDLFKINGGWFSKPTEREFEQQKQFTIWFNKRFKPVYLTWKTALSNIVKDKTVSMSNAWFDLTPEQREMLLPQTSMGAEVYAGKESPFPDTEIMTGSGAVTEAYDEAKAEIAKDLKKDPTDTAKGVAGEASSAVAAAGGVTAMASVSLPGDRTPGVADGKSEGNLRATAAAGISATASILRPDAGLQRLTALQSIRYKAYGLTELELERVATLSQLERAVEKDISMVAGSEASYSKSSQEAFAEFGQSFGIALDDTAGRRAWQTWFEQRFLPVLLTYISACRQFSATMNLWVESNQLDAATELSIAKAIVGAKRKSFGISLSIWSSVISPWDGKPLLNGASKSTEDNIRHIEERSKRRRVEEATASNVQAPSVVQAMAQSRDTVPNAARPAGNFGGALDIGQSTRLNPVRSNDLDRQHAEDAAYWNALGVDPNGIAMKDNRIAGGEGVEVRHPGNGTGGNINNVPMANGRGLHNVQDTIVTAARMVGVDPQLMLTLAHMESSFDPYAVAEGTKATGLNQFLARTWEEQMGKHAEKYGIAPETSALDPRANALLGAEYVKYHSNELEKVLGRPPTDVEVYMAHFFGLSGAKKMLQANPQDTAAAVRPAAAASNRAIFYSGSSPRTVSGVIAELSRRMSSKRVTFDAPANSAVASTAPTAPTGTVAANAGSAPSSVSGAVPAPTTTASSVVPAMPIAVPVATAAAPATTAVSSDWSAVQAGVSGGQAQTGEAVTAVSDAAARGAGGAVGTAKAKKAAEVATRKAGRKSTGWCARAVSDALLAAGYKFQKQPSAYMYQTNNVLGSIGFQSVPATGPYQVGDVMVIARSDRRPHGHIQIFNGQQWVSDFLQRSVSPYREPNPMTLWRDTGRGGAAGAATSAAPAAPWSAVAAPANISSSDGLVRAGAGLGVANERDAMVQQAVEQERYGSAQTAQRDQMDAASQRRTLETAQDLSRRQLETQVAQLEKQTVMVQHLESLVRHAQLQGSAATPAPVEGKVGGKTNAAAERRRPGFDANPNRSPVNVSRVATG